MKAAYAIFLLAAAVATSAIAQEAAPTTIAQEAQPAIPVPAIIAPPTPAAPVPQAQMQPQQGVVPPLPPSNPCAQNGLLGIWKLARVYENPASAETAAFSSFPYQFLTLNADSTYKEYKSATNEAGKVVFNKIRFQQPPNLQQYLSHESGALYFYKDGVATDTQMCFIVASAQGEFKAGQMLLMPPQGQSSVRLIKVYDHTWAPRSNRRR